MCRCQIQNVSARVWLRFRGCSKKCHAGKLISFIAMFRLRLMFHPIPILTWIIVCVAQKSIWSATIWHSIVYFYVVRSYCCGDLVLEFGDFRRWNQYAAMDVLASMNYLCVCIAVSSTMRYSKMWCWCGGRWANLPRSIIRALMLIGGLFLCDLPTNGGCGSAITFCMQTYVLRNFVKGCVPTWIWANRTCSVIHRSCKFLCRVCGAT